MSFQGYTERIMNLCEYQQGDNKPKTTKKQKIQRRFQVKNTEVKMVLCILLKNLNLQI